MYFPRRVFDPVPSNMSRSAIEAFAEDVAKRLDFRQDPNRYAVGGVNTEVLDLIRRLGGRVHNGPSTMPTQSANHDDSLIVFGNSDFIVHPCPNPLLWESIDASQAVLNACEIGHLFLHYPMVRKAHGAEPDTSIVMVAARHPYGEVEQRCAIETYWFAFTLIFPSASFARSGTDIRATLTRSPTTRASCRTRCSIEPYVSAC